MAVLPALQAPTVAQLADAPKPLPRLPADMTRHNTLITRDPPSGGWQAWCKPCGWHGPIHPWAWAARLDKDQHEEGA